MSLQRLLVFALAVTMTVPVLAQQKFSQLVGQVEVKPANTASPIEIPYITWGGDVAEFYANGTSLTTKQGSINSRHGLNLKLVNGDDFVGQVKAYLGGRPFLRGTFRMLGQASEVLGKDPRTKPVVILQLTYSLGDSIVARSSIKTLNDLKPKNGKKVRIACQQGGPHPGLIYDALATVGLTNSDIEIVWVADLTGPKGPAEAFRKDATLDACCVITPDMIGLTSGLDSTGSGAEGTVKGAHVLVSTAQMSRSIADVWAVRKDYYDANKETVEKFVAGYLEAVSKVVPMRKGFDDSGRMSAEYKKLLTFSQQTFGEEVLPTLEEDAHGLLLDASFVGLPGNISFFEDAGNQSGFEPKQKAALDLATSWGYATVRSGFDPSGLDWKRIASLAKIAYTPPKITKRINAESIDFFPDSGLEENTIASFTITFQPNQTSFSADTYGADFQRAVKSASTFGNAVIAVRGHSDPTKTLGDLVRAGMKKGLIKRSGNRGSYKYYLSGKELKLTDTKAMVQLIEANAFDGVDPNPRDTMNAALNLSLSRAKAVVQAVNKYSKDNNLTLDTSQIQPAGAGILEPLVAKPTNINEAKQNMRVEFRIMKVPAEALNQSDFDF